MTDARRTTLPDVTFNWPVASRGLLASLCLVGFSSNPNSSWLIYPAIAVLAYTIYTGAPIRRMFFAPDLRRMLSRWCPRLIAAAALFAVAGMLSDGPGILAYAGSSLFLLMLAAVGAFAVMFLFGALRRVPALAGESSVRVYHQLRLQARLAWLSVTG